MIEQVLKGRNIQKAIHQTVANKGSAGIDKMPVTALKLCVQTHKTKLFTSIVNQRYVPQAIIGVEIPKPNGKTRLLGVPTVVDRMLQQAVNQAITPLFELTFHENSYGFRPEKNAHQALLQSQKNINEGYKYIVEIDLKSFFDEVDHAILLQLIYRKVNCATTLRLIRKWLKAPIQIKGKLVKRIKGIPQGSPLSPLLSNIILHELDTYLDKKGKKFVRYADDFSIYTKSKRSAKEIGNQVFLFLKNKLKLPINREKSGIRTPSTFKILGYGFTSSFEKGSKGQYQLIVLEKSWDKVKASIKEITRKTKASSFDERIAELKLMQRGWLNYFKLGNIVSKLKAIDRWVRQRLRYCIWTDWKKPERRRKNLIRLGVNYDKAYAYSRTRKGGWAVAQSPIMGTTITLARLAKRGYESMEGYFQKMSPICNEPLYTRPVRTVVREPQPEYFTQVGLLDWLKFFHSGPTLNEKLYSILSS